MPPTTREPSSPAPAVAAPPPGRRKAWTIGGLGLGARAAFTGQLATLQDAGLPLVRSLKVLLSQQKPGVLSNALLDVVDDVEGGTTLSEALSRHPRAFDRLYVGMVRAGEASGALDVILDRLAHFLEKSLRLRKKVIGALVYPAVVSVVAVGILAGIMTFVIPSFEQLFEETGVPLPAPTELLIAASGLVASYWFLLPLLPAALALALRLSASHPRGRYALDRLQRHLPVFGTILHRAATARFCRTLGTLITSGVPILEALSITREATTNTVIARALDEVHASIREGESVARPLQECGAFDALLVNMIDIGEETGELDRMLTKVADGYEADLDTAVESLSSILEPLLIVGMGGAVGFIVIALFLPLIELMNQL